jgi:hypothetical protein
LKDYAMLRMKFEVTVAALVSASFLGALNAQSVAPSRATNVRFAIAEGYNLGRGVTNADSMFVKHRVDYCLSGGSPSDFGNLTVGFESKRVNEAMAKSGRGKGLVRGEFSTVQEPLDGRNRRCGSFSFDVHADTLLSAQPFAQESDPKVFVRSVDGKTIATLPLTSGSGNRKK